MDYIGDRAHLEWKLSVTDRVLSEEIPALERAGRVEGTTRMDYPRYVSEFLNE